MAFVATDKDGSEWIYKELPFRENDKRWFPSDLDRDCFDLPKDSIRKLIGKDLTWEDEPVELKAEE
ncbi:MAG: hypothetical protein NC548_34645 [Lachnospiraceae bacterium]|nr:hypothetical protein [Lachnospiraceae bacterium]